MKNKYDDHQIQFIESVEKKHIKNGGKPFLKNEAIYNCDSIIKEIYKRRHRFPGYTIVNIPNSNKIKICDVDNTIIGIIEIKWYDTYRVVKNRINKTINDYIDQEFREMYTKK